MNWLPDVPVPDPDKFMEQIRRMQQERRRAPPTLEGCTDAQLETEVQRRKERREQQVKEAIKLVEGAGYTVVKGSGG